VLRSRSRGQTAIEALFIAAIILVGIAYLVPTFSEANSSVTLTKALRDAGSGACSYLNTAVLVNDSLYRPLNELIALNNYTPLNCRFIGVSLNGSATVAFQYTGPEGPFTGNVSLYIKLRLARLPGFELIGERLYHNGREVNVTVVVR